MPQLQKMRKQVLGDWLGLGVGVPPPPEPDVGLAEAEPDGWPGGLDPPPAGLVCFGVADAEAEEVAEWLGVGECDGRFTTDMPVPSEELADWLLLADGETAARIVVAAPLVKVGPLPVNSLYPVMPSARAATPPMTSERRRLLRALSAAWPEAPGPLRSRRRAACPAAPGGAGSHTALIAGP